MKFKLSIVALLFLASSTMLFAQEPNATDGKERARIDGVVRVFMHQPGDYSVMTWEKDEFQVYRIYQWASSVTSEKFNWFSGNTWNYVEELLKSKDGKMSAVVREYPSTKKIVTSIYITSEEDVNGAGWISGGKFPIQGTTAIVR